MAVTHFVTQFTHISRHFGVYSRKQKKMVRANCFESVVSDLKKKCLCVHKTTFRKKCKNKNKNKNKNHENFFNLWRILGTKQVLLVDIWDRILKQFSLNNCFLFSTLNSKITRNMCKLRHKVRKGQNLPHKSLNFMNYFFLSNFKHNLVHFSTNLRPHYQDSFFLNNFLLLFYTLNCRMS